jgi:acyl dehydratase
MAMYWDPPELGSSARLTKEVTAEDVALYAQITGDLNPLHFDEDFARRTRFGRLIAQGGITTEMFNALVAMKLPGPGSVFLHQEWEYPAPVFIGDTVTAEVVVVEISRERRTTKLDCVARNQDAKEVLRGTSTVYTVPTRSG